MTQTQTQTATAVINAALKGVVPPKDEGKSLDAMVTKVHVTQVEHHDGKLMLPRNMTIPDAIDLLNRRQKYLEEKVAISDQFNVFPWDGAAATDTVLTRRYGWTQQEATQGFFGKNPPQMIGVEIAPGLVKQVPWGKFSLPGITGELNTGVSERDGRMIFALTATVARKNEEEVRALFAEVRDELAKNSIYRGKAIKLRFYDDDGEKLALPEPKFMDVSAINEDLLVYSDDVMSAINTNLFTPITRVHDLIANGIAVKRGVLLGGTYGTGKTLAANVAAKRAVANGITFLYVPRANELAEAISFALQYQSPACVIFCEDVDREATGPRTAQMDDLLNIVDGIDSKTANILVVLTSNAMDKVHQAMLRPGRLDAVIEVTPPDAKAVQKLLRVYGGGAITADTDLSEVGKELDGCIPAVIAEVVKRAKLAQLAMQAPGTKVRSLSQKALLEAARTMHKQLSLLNRKDERAKVPSLDRAFRDAVNAGISERNSRVISTATNTVAVSEATDE